MCLGVTLEWFGVGDFQAQATAPSIRIARTVTGGVEVAWPVGDGLYALDQAEEFPIGDIAWVASVAGLELVGGSIGSDGSRPGTPGTSGCGAFMKCRLGSCRNRAGLQHYHPPTRWRASPRVRRSCTRG